jgi:hypothetical protein
MWLYSVLKNSFSVLYMRFAPTSGAPHPSTATPSPRECQNRAFAGTPIRRSLPSQIAQRRRNSGALVLGTPAEWMCFVFRSL